MATARTRSAVLLHMAWAMFMLLPCSVFSSTKYCSVSKMLACEETHVYMFQSRQQFDDDIKCYISFSTTNDCNMAITVRDVNMAPPDANGECTADKLQFYNLMEQELVPGNTYCGNGPQANGTEENTMSGNVALVVLLSKDQQSPCSFTLEVKTTKVGATGTEEPSGTEGSESPGSTGPVVNSTTVAPEGSSNSTERVPGGSVNTTKRPVGSGNVTATTPPTDEEGPPAGGVGTPPGGEGPPAGGEGSNGTLPTTPRPPRG